MVYDEEVLYNLDHVMALFGHVSSENKVGYIFRGKVVDVS